MRNGGPIGGAVLLFAVFLGAGAFFVHQVEQGRRHEQRRNVAQLAVGAAHSLEHQISSSLSATYALAAILRQAGTIKDFDALAAEMIRIYGGINSLQLAPGGVITTIYPRAGNEKAIGHNLLQDPLRRTEALRAVESRQLALAGPFELRQGGVGAIGRLAVFVPDGVGGERFWGFVNVMMRLPDLLAASNLETLERGGCRYELTRLNPDTGRWESIAHSDGPLQAPVESTIDVPNGKWKLAVAPKNGWQNSPFSPLNYFLVGGISGILALLAYLMLRQPGMLRQEVLLRTADLEEANRQLEAEIRERRRAEGEARRLNADLERRVAQRTAQLEGSNRELESFSYSVSHDLRAPLRHMESFSRILAEDHGGQIDEGGRQCLERIEAGIRRMKLHIESLLELARLGRDPLRVSMVDLSGMVREIAAQLAASGPGRRVSFPVTDGIAVWGDADLLRVALEQLLGNAWKFTETRDEARIEFGVSETDDKRLFFVRDNGVGFDMRYADRLFGAFERLHGADEYEGVGIGLATVQRIIRRHGGEIWAEAKVDEGATFFFTLNSPGQPESEPDPHR